MGYRMITRMDGDNAGEKCPNCKFIGRTFLSLSDDLWGCMDCGCVFVPKRKRIEIREKIADQQKGVEEVNPLKCDFPGCDYVAPIPVALAGHKRKHERTDSIKP